MTGRLDGRNGTDLTIAIGVATAGRPAVLRDTILGLTAQTRQPDAVVVCAPDESDVESLRALPAPPRLLIGHRGLPHQRNAILDALGGHDVVVFLDDDFVPDSTYLCETAKVFRAHPTAVMTTGRVLADGAIGPGLTRAQALAILAAADAGTGGGLEDLDTAYGCNMAVRLAAARLHGVRFDENLPLYAWLEDLDFSARMRRHGRVLRIGSALGVHLGVKSGRQSGRRLGYSQVANPVYLVRKGTLSPTAAARQIGRNMAANIARSAWPEPYVDRAGRVAGNLYALADLLGQRLDPARALSL